LFSFDIEPRFYLFACRNDLVVKDSPDLAQADIDHIIVDLSERHSAFVGQIAHLAHCRRTDLENFGIAPAPALGFRFRFLLRSAHPESTPSRYRI
jgi:hypothetical protein